MANLVIISDYNKFLKIPDHELKLVRDNLKDLVENLNGKDYVDKLRESGKSDVMIRYNVLWWIPNHFWNQWACRMYKEYGVNDVHIDNALKYVIGIKE